MDFSFGQSTWPLLLRKSALNVCFYLMFSAQDSQPTWPLGSTGSPQLCLAFGLFCFMEYIHDQLTLLQTTSFQIFLVFACFFAFFIVVHTYCHRLIKKQPPSGRSSRYILRSHLFCISLSYRIFKRGHKNGPSNIAFRCSQQSVPMQEGNECNFIMTASGSDLTFSQLIAWV